MLQVAWDEVDALPESGATTAPLCVYVQADEPSDATRHLESVTLTHEKVCLALKAFRTLKVGAASAAADPRLGGRSAAVPRLVLLQPGRERPIVLERPQFGPSGVFAQLERVSDACYEQRLASVVRTQLELLTDQDTLALRACRLNEARGAALARNDDTTTAALAAIDVELAGIRVACEEIAVRQVALWRLTRRKEEASGDGGAPPRPATLGVRPGAGVGGPPRPVGR